MKNKALVALTILAAIVAFTGCVKDTPDEPPLTTIPFDPDKVLTIGQIKNIYSDSSGAYTFEEGYSLFATVIMDEESGNIYRSSFVQDGSGGIQLNFLNPGGLYLGDSIRVYLKGGTIDNYHELFQINNLDVGSNVEKIATNHFIEPEVVTLTDLQNNISYYQSTLVQINDVQFSDTYVGGTFADSARREDQNVMLRNCLYNEVIVRTSGFANFANRPVPDGRGNLIAVASVYNNDVQMTIRSYQEINFNKPRCEQGSGGETLLFTDFNEDWSGWTTRSDYGAQQWTRIDEGGPDGSACASINGFELGYHQNEDWLISPGVDVTGKNVITLAFKSAKNFDGDDITVYISSTPDFSSNYFSLDNDLYTLSSGSFTWVNSGYVDVSFFSGSELYIGFKYESSNTDGAAWRIDDVTVKGE